MQGESVMKILNTAVFLLIICLTFAACSQNSANQAEGDKSATDIATGEEVAETTAEPSYYDTLGERDFGGASFKILRQTSGGTIDMFYSGEEQTGEPISDSSYMRDRLIEEKYNVKVEYIESNWDQVPNLLKNSFAAGDELSDMVISSFITLSVPVQNNLLSNIADMPHLSLTSPWWSKLIYDNMTLDGKLFYTAGDIFPGTYMAPSAVYVNQSLLNDYGITDNLYELVFSGKWTIDVLQSLTKDIDADLNLDGRMNSSDDFYGFIQQNNTLASNAFCVATGVKLSTKIDNTLIVDFSSVSNVEKIDKLTNFLKKISYTDQNAIITDTFHNGRALFLTHFLESALLYLRTMEADYGILPMPKYDEVQETYASFLNPWSSSSVCVPRLVDTEKVGFLMEAMAYASYELIRPNVYELALKTKFARDEESARIIDLIIETSYLDLNGVYNFGGSTDVVNAAVFDKKPLVSSYAAKEGAIQNAIDTYIAAISQGG
jgi:ABC-type glycerol-3-phosphate transport system substrate-binding protein